MIFSKGFKERIGYDFYCDVAINIVNRRKKLELTQEELAEKSKIKLSRLRKIENVQYRIRLEELEILAKVFNVTVNNLINDDDDSQAGDCRYLVWVDFDGNDEYKEDRYKFYSDACNKRMAFLKLEQKLNEQRLSLIDNSRSRVWVELVGIPVTDKQLQDKLPKYKKDMEIEK